MIDVESKETASSAYLELARCAAFSGGIQNQLAPAAIAPIEVDPLLDIRATLDAYRQAKQHRCQEHCWYHF